jgi:hypothetical protein
MADVDESGADSRAQDDRAQMTAEIAKASRQLPRPVRTPLGGKPALGSQLAADIARASRQLPPLQLTISETLDPFDRSSPGSAQLKGLVELRRISETKRAKDAIRTVTGRTAATDAMPAVLDLDGTDIEPDDASRAKQTAEMRRDFERKIHAILKEHNVAVPVSQKARGIRWREGDSETVPAGNAENAKVVAGQRANKVCGFTIHVPQPINSWEGFGSAPASFRQTRSA